MKLDPIEGEYKDPLPKNKNTKRRHSKLICPNCSTRTKSANINLDKMIAKCDTCNFIFSFDKLADTLKSSTKSNPKPIVGNQKEIDIFEYEGELSISYINYLDYWTLIIFCLGFCMLFPSFLVISDGGTAPILLSLGIPLFLYGLYRTILYKENKIYIDIDNIYLTIHPAHKYIERKKTYLNTDIKQVYTKVHPGTNSYEIFFIYDGLKGEEHIKLRGYFRSRSSALYIEQELESFLGIKDEPVADETKF